VTREKAEGAKAYIERKYAKLKNEEKEKKEGSLSVIKRLCSMGQVAKADGQNEPVAH
jgi:hypothetical protein